MTNLERYEEIKESFNEYFEFKDNKLFINNNELGVINNQIPNFINNELDELTNKMSDFYDDVKFPNYDDMEDYASLYEKGIKNLFQEG